MTFEALRCETIVRRKQLSFLSLFYQGRRVLPHQLLHHSLSGPRQRSTLLATLTLIAVGLIAYSRSLDSSGAGAAGATGGAGKLVKGRAAASPPPRSKARGAAAPAPTPPPPPPPLPPPPVEVVPVAPEHWALNVTAHQQHITSASREDGALLYIFDTIGHGGRFYVEYGYGSAVRECSGCNSLNLYKHGWRGLLMDACAAFLPSPPASLPCPCLAYTLFALRCRLRLSRPP